eukprot:g16493.t1
MSGVEPGPPPAQLNTSAFHIFFIGIACIISTLTPDKVKLGKFPKDTGETSSRLAEIQKQAKKTPAPGKYDKVDTWADPAKKSGTRGIGESCAGFGNAFEKASRWKGDAEDMVKKRGPMPGPGHYESKEVNMKPMNSVKQSLSDIRRPVFGYMPKGKKETYLDKIGKGGNVGPPPSKYAHITQSAIARNMLEMHKPGLKFSVGGKTDIRKKKQPPSLAPNHYSINYKSQDIKQPMSTFPKEKSANFIDQTVRSKSWQPAPGKYDLIKVEKYSRGTKYCQVNNIARCAVNGLF